MKELKTPVGTLKVYINDILYDYDVVQKDLGLFIDDSDNALYPDGLYSIFISLANIKKDSKIVAIIEGANMKADGGDEGYYNMIGVNESYTYGLGASDEYYHQGVAPFRLDSSNRADGYCYTILEDLDDDSEEEIELIIAWIKDTTDKAFDCISYVTC